MISKQPRMKKALAMLLTALLLLGVVPLGIFNALAQDADAFTLKIVGDDGNAVEASITVKTVVDGNDEPILFDSTPSDYTYAATGSSIELSKINEYLEKNPTKEVRVEYTVTASGYATSSGSCSVTESTLAANPVHTVKLNKEMNVRVNLAEGFTRQKSMGDANTRTRIYNFKKDDNASINASAIKAGVVVAEMTAGAAYIEGTVEKDSYIAVAFPEASAKVKILDENGEEKGVQQKTKYVKISGSEYSETITSQSYDYFIFKVENNLEINAEYIDIVYTVRADITNDGGVLKAGGTNYLNNGEIKIEAANNKSIVISPKSEYELKKLCVDGHQVFPEMDKSYNFAKVIKSFEKINDSDYELVINGPEYQNVFGGNEEKYHRISADFKLKLFDIETSKTGNGGITAKSDSSKNKDEAGKITATSNLLIEATSTDAYYLKSLKVVDDNGKEVKNFDVFTKGDNGYSSLSYVDGIKTYKFTAEKITSNVKVIAEFAEIESIDVNAFEAVNVNADNVSFREDIPTPTFFVRYEKNNTATITAKDFNIGDTVYTIKAFDCKTADRYHGWSDKLTTGKDKGISGGVKSVVVITEDGKAYLCKGEFDVKIDINAPTINKINVSNSFVNTMQEIDFSINEGSGSGLNFDTLEVIRSYKDVTDEKVDVTYKLREKDNEYNNIYDFKIEAEPIKDYCGTVTYTVKVSDNVGNAATAQKFTIYNDTVAPALTDGKNAVEFKIKNGNVFAHILNKISRGKWFEEKLQVIVTATDGEGVGFGNDNSIAYIRLVNEDGSVFVNGSGKIDNKGKAEIIFAGFNVKDTFKGTVEYKLSDALVNVTGNKENEGWLLLTSANSNFNESNIIMLEAQPPVISNIKVSPASAENGVAYTDDSGRYIANGDIQFEATVTDAFSGIYSYSVDINGEGLISKTDMKQKLADNTEAEVKSEKINVTTDSVKADKNDAYVFTIKDVADYAGNSAENKTATVYKDTTAPDIVGFDFSLDKLIDINKEGNLFKAVVVTDYGFYFKQDVVVTIQAEDLKSDEELASGVKYITYYAVDINGSVIKGENVPVDKNNKISFVINKDFKGQIYAMAIDNVDNSLDKNRAHKDYDASALITEGEYKGFAHPNGSIIENIDKHVGTSKIEIVPTKQAAGTQNNTYEYNYDKEATPDKAISCNVKKNVPLYAENPEFEITVEDNYSGIREVSYTIIEGKKTTTETVKIDNEGEFSDKNTTWTKAENKADNLVYKISKSVVVSGNCNDMVLLVELTDRAGNKSYDYYVFGIDKTAPAITLTYDNNAEDVVSGTGSYFKAVRTATILIEERNFNTENVKFKIANAEGKAPQVIDQKLIKADKDGNGDKDTYKYVIEYVDDGVYTFGVEYTDRAGNKNTVNTKDSAAPYAFTIDKVLPTISVSYSNNDAQNAKYFKAGRTATIVIKEHNFDVNRVNISMTSSLSGSIIAKPSTTWTDNGDIHTAVINYNADGDYTFDITMTDKAGNVEAAVDYGASAAPKEFTVDTTYANIVKVDGIANGGVLGLSGDKVDPNAKITITINDVNLDSYNIKLTRSRVLVDGISNNNEEAEKNSIIDNPEKQQYEVNVDASKFVSSPSGSSNATVTISIPERDKETGMSNDGVYTLTIQAKDKAGNAYDTNSHIITFSVNRFGSVFTFSNDLYKLITDNDGYHQTKDVTGKKIEVYEYNAKSIEKEIVEISKDKEKATLTKGTDYDLSSALKQGASSWSKYTYSIFDKNFAADGEYELNISSKDDSTHQSSMDYYDICKAVFSVDNNAPRFSGFDYSTEVKKSKLGDTYSATTDKLTVNFSIDDNIRLYEIIAEVENGDGYKEIPIAIDSTDSFESAGNHAVSKSDVVNKAFKGSFTLEESEKIQKIRITAKDKAGNSITTDEAEFDNFDNFYGAITVSTSKWVQFRNNSTLFYGSIALVAVLIAAAVCIIIIRRKKRA